MRPATSLQEHEVRAIIDRVRNKLRDSGLGEASQPRVESVVPATGEGGIFPTIDSAVHAARRAFLDYRVMGLNVRHGIIDAIRGTMLGRVDELSHMAHEETGLGRFEDKVLKNKLVIERTPGPEDLETQAWTGDEGLTITEPAPFGVIGAITPTTNPTATIINNSIAAIAAGNALVFNAHPNAKKVSVQTIRWINEAVVSAGGPANLATAVPEPTIETAQGLMHHDLVRILLVTGGPGVVDEARKTKKRSILAGPGNPPVVVDETADIELAGREIVRGASFDNNLICTDEKEVFVVEAVAGPLMKALEDHGAYLLRRSELERIEKLIFREKGGPEQAGRIEPKWIGQNADRILAAIGVQASRDIRLVIAPVPPEHSLVWTEQMMPVLPVARVKNVDEAIDFAVRAEHGCCHTASIFSRDVNAITRMAREIDVSIFVANNATLAGLGSGGEGFSSFSIASPTGEGLTRPRSFSRERRMTVAGGLRIV